MSSSHQKNKILVIGGESSGSRLLVEIIRNQGGNVIHRSMPYAQEFIDLEEFDDMDLFVISVRSWPYMIASQVRVRHAKSEEDAKIRTQKAYSIIFEYLNKKQKNYFIITYESLINSPEFMQKWICEKCGLEFDPNKMIKINNENKKYERQKKI